MSEREPTIMQINDLHGYIEPHPEVFRARGGCRYETRGGLARIATLFKQVRAERPGAVLALDNGDTFHGTYVAVESRGEAMAAMLGEQGVPMKYGGDRRRIGVDAIEALQQLFASTRQVRGNRRGSVVAV